MCGLVGLIKKDASKIAEENILQAMNDSILHRGPDGEGLHIQGPVGLGHRRLSIIDLAGGAQPMSNEEQTVHVVFNGEIYNYKELYDELEGLGYKFNTNSDTEVLIHGWSEWGVDSVKKLQGMFAYSLWDKKDNTLFIARDRLGIKPLYYSCLDNGDIIFGSEMKTLLAHPGLSREINYQAVEDYFAFGHIPEPKSILKNVHKLQAGHTLLLDINNLKLTDSKEYWDVSFEKNIGSYSQEDLQGVLNKSVDDHLVSEVSLGAFLSGGVDSSAVVAMMSKSLNSQVKTCSISFADKEFSEESYATEVAELFNTDHYAKQVDINDLSIIDELVKAYDEPFADSSALPTYKLCELARQKVTVALSGDGGVQAAIRGLNPVLAKSGFNGMFDKLRKLSKLGMSPAEAFSYSAMVTDPVYRNFAYSEGFSRNLDGYKAQDVILHYANKADTDDSLALAQYIDMKVYMCSDILTKVDRASMAHSLEVRVPLIDHNVVEWACANINSEDKIKGGELKAPLKKAFESTLPHDILYRPKMGFSVPIKSWLQTSLKVSIDEILQDSAVLSLGIFDRKNLNKLVSHHYSGRADHSSFLWSLLMFEGSMKHIGKYKIKLLCSNLMSFVPLLWRSL